MDALLLAEIGETVASSTASVAARAEQAQPQRTREEAMLGNRNAAKDRNSSDNVTAVSTERGNNADYLTARIARDRPDILERMKAGEYKSVRAAAKDAGLVKERVRIPLDPDEVGRVILRRFDAAQITALIEVHRCLRSRR